MYSVFRLMISVCPVPILAGYCDLAAALVVLVAALNYYLAQPQVTRR